MTLADRLLGFQPTVGLREGMARQTAWLAELGNEVRASLLALHAAKTSGDDATVTITDLAAQVAPPGPVAADIGCGRGTITLGLARRLAPAQLIALD